MTSDASFWALKDFSIASAARMDSSFGKGCPPTEAAFIGGGWVSVTPNQRFNVPVQFIAGNPGHHQACAYLFNAASPDGPQVHRGVGYRVGVSP